MRSSVGHRGRRTVFKILRRKENLRDVAIVAVGLATYKDGDTLRF